jgi:hypothetical protein
MSRRLATLALIALALGAAAPAFAQINASNDFEAYSAVMGAGKNAVLVRRLHQVPSVGVIAVRGGSSPSAGSGDESGDIRMIAQQRSAAVHALRSALAANPVTRNALAANGVDIGKVIGVQVGGSGALRVFLDQ